VYDLVIRPVLCYGLKKVSILRDTKRTVDVEVWIHTATTKLYELVKEHHPQFVNASEMPKGFKD
jgi:hypothetical protein